MADRPVPGSLRWLGMLVALALVAAIAGGLALYVETRAKTRATATMLARGDVDTGRRAMLGYACGSCHAIPGIAGAEGAVGPPLAGIATRATIAGTFANDPATMVRWLRHPQRLRPGTAMPEQGVTATDARDMAAYLYTLR